MSSCSASRAAIVGFAAYLVAIAVVGPVAALGIAVAAAAAVVVWTSARARRGSAGAACSAPAGRQRRGRRPSSTGAGRR